MKTNSPFILMLLFLFWNLGLVVGPCLGQEGQEGISPQINYNAYEFRDPFESYLPKEEVQALSEQDQELMDAEAEQQPKPLPPLNIQGIIWKGKLKQAIINNRVVKIGDEIEEAKVVAIEREGITFIYDKREYKVNAPAYSTYGNLIK